MALKAIAVTVGTVLTNGDIAPLLASQPDPLVNLAAIGNYTSANLYGLNSAQLAGLTTTQIMGVVSTQLGGITSTQTAAAAVQSSLTKDVVLLYNTSTVSTKNVMRKLLAALTLSIEGQNDLS